jgi:hypothetical protein
MGLARLLIPHVLKRKVAEKVAQHPKLAVLAVLF